MKHAKRTLSILLTLVLVIGTLSIGWSVSAAGSSSVVKFGNYPQSEVKDSKLIAKLFETEKVWKSYNYYSAGKVSDYMKYADFMYDGQGYRAVSFTQYRPNTTSETAGTSGNGSGYSTDLIYYFKYEPIEWIVLDASSGLLLSKKLLDAQAFHNGTTKDYAASSIRSFLIGDFYRVAFSEPQKSLVKTPDYDCSVYGKTGAKTLKDKVTLLSYHDCLVTSYGFKDTIYADNARVAKETTDYAMCQGIDFANGIGNWWLRTVDDSNSRACCVDKTGALSHQTTENMVNKGVRPVISISSVADNTELSLQTCPHNGAKEVFDEVKATCTKPGHERYVICTLCSKVIEGSAAEIPAAGHEDKKMLNGDPGSDGWCDNCGEELSIHLDNSGKLQLEGPFKAIVDLIRKLVEKLSGMFDKDKQSEPFVETERSKMFDNIADMLGAAIKSITGAGVDLTKTDTSTDTGAKTDPSAGTQTNPTAGTQTGTGSTGGTATTESGSAGESLDAISGPLSGIIGMFKDMGEKKNDEKQTTLNSFLGLLQTVFTDNEETTAPQTNN